MQRKKYDCLFKVLLIGESGVGKTAITQRYCDNTFDPVYISTVGVDFKPKIITIGSTTIKLQFWDTAGQERFRNITTSYYRGTHGVVMVYDTTDMSSFTKVMDWFNEVIDRTTDKTPVIYLVGNKMDLKDFQVVTKEMAENLSKKMKNVKSFECSAKTGEGVNELFEEMSKDIFSTQEIEVDDLFVELPKKKTSKFCCF